MSIEIKVIENKKDLKKFVKLPFDIYRDNEIWIPQLIMDDIEVFNPQKNPAYEHSDSRLFLAYKDGIPVGRIAALISHAANKKYDTKNLRFGWFECINDPEVSKALFNAAEKWGKEQGMETITGPLGFTDLDPEGLLIEGFDQEPTIASNFNHPYYPELIEQFGFEKEIDYFEFRSVAPHEEGIPPKLLRLADRIKERSGVRLHRFKTRREMINRSGELFDVLNDTFEEIYGSTPLTRSQINYYIKKYINFAKKELIVAVVNDKDEMVGFMISMPSLSQGFRKARGRLLPFGWWHILKSLRTYEVIDFYLAGIKKKYRGTGVDLMMVLELVKVSMKLGFKYSESNLELETNTKIHAQWKYFNPTLHKKRRIYRKTL